MMIEKRWLTKEQKRLLKPHAQYYGAMCAHIREATILELEQLHIACMACTEINCGWDEYAAAQYLKGEIEREVGWRNRTTAEAIESIDPALHIHARMTDDGAPSPDAA